MKKLAFAAAVLAATAFSGSAFALSADSAKGLQVSNGAVKVCYCHRPIRHYHHHCGRCANHYVVQPCGCGYGIAYWGRAAAMAAAGSGPSRIRGDACSLAHHLQSAARVTPRFIVELNISQEQLTAGQFNSQRAERPSDPRTLFRVDTAYRSRRKPFAKFPFIRWRNRNSLLRNILLPVS